MTPAIRPATLKDVDAIHAIYAESVKNGIGTYEIAVPDLAEMTKRFLSISGDNFPYLVAVDGDDTVLGYAYASPFRTREAYDWICEDSIYVGPDARGRSVGKLLLEALIAQTEKLGFRQMVAVIGGANPASVRLHEAQGFVHVGRMPSSGFKQGQWLDTVIMQLPMGEGARTTPDHAPAAGARRVPLV